MAIQYRSKTEYSGTGASHNVNVPSGVADGDIIILHIGAVQNYTPGVPGGFTLQESIAGVDGIWIYTKIAASEASSYTITLGNQFQSVVVTISSYYSDAAEDIIVDVSGKQDNGSSTTTQNYPSITTTLADTMLLALGSYALSVTTTPDAAMSERYDYGALTHNHLMDEVLSSTGPTGTRSTTTSGNTTSRVVMMAIGEDIQAEFVRATAIGAYIELLPGLTAPLNLVATAVAATQINLAWTDNTTLEDTYYVERSDDGGSTWFQIAVLAADSEAYSDLGVAAETEYCYRVRAGAAEGGGTVYSDYSNVDCATTPGYTAQSVAPDLTATAYSPSAILIALTYSPPVGYPQPTDWLWQWSANGTDWLFLASTTSATAFYRHTGLTPATTYYYRAFPLFSGDAGQVSNVASATTLTMAIEAGVALWIDVRDASNNKLGPGPLTEAVSWRNVRRLSRAGEFAVDFPATYMRLHEIQADGEPLLNNDRYLFCYGILADQITLIGAGLIKEIELTRQGGAAPLITVSGPDLLGELRRVTVYTVGRPYQYDILDSDSAPLDLINDFATGAPALPADWTIDGGNPTGANVTAKFVHATLLSAFIDIGSKIGEFFRLGTGNDGREIKWLGPPAAFADSGIRAELSINPIAAENNADACLITEIAEIKDSWDLYTRAYVFGAGQGHDRLDLAAVTQWPDGHRYRSDIVSVTGDGAVVTVTTAQEHELTVGEDIELVGTVNYDTTGVVASTPTTTTFTFASAATGATSTGYLYGDQTHTMDGDDYFIRHTDSSLDNLTVRTAYGRHHTAIQFKEISPISNSDADVSAAANALLAAAYYWLREHSRPAKFYRLAVSKLDALLLPGQTIRVVARGFIDDNAYINIDTALTILETATEIGRGGVRTTGLTVATVNRWPSSDGDQAAQEFRQAAIYQSLAQLGPSVDTISYLDYIDDDVGATLHFFLGDETAIVNQVIVRFRTDKLRSTVKSVGGTSTSTGSGGGATPTTDSGGGVTPTTTSGGGVTPTTTSGGGVTPTTTSGSGHNHEIDLADSTTGSQVYFAGTGSPPTGDLRTSGGGKINSSSTGSDHTHDVTIPSHTHDVTVPAHTHDVTVPAHTHDVTVPAHTHDVTAAISAAYGIYEDPDTAYAPTDLEFSINNNTYRSDYNAITGATGWYVLDITDEVAGLAQRPLNVANSVAVRIKSASQTGKKCQITVQVERRCVIQSIATL